MQRLRALTGRDVDDLGEVKLDLVAELQQKAVSQVEHDLVHDQFTTCRASCHESTGASGQAANEVVSPCRSRGDPRLQFLSDTLLELNPHQSTDDDGTISVEGCENLVEVVIRIERHKFCHRKQ